MQRSFERKGRECLQLSESAKARRPAGDKRLSCSRRRSSHTPAPPLAVHNLAVPGALFHERHQQPALGPPALSPWQWQVSLLPCHLVPYLYLSRRLCPYHPSLLSKSCRSRSILTSIHLHTTHSLKPCPPDSQARASLPVGAPTPSLDVQSQATRT